jgi:hypothetical protein
MDDFEWEREKICYGLVGKKFRKQIKRMIFVSCQDKH